ncbi:uncharacterized protein BYT42DRAFT_469859, partial [Radiomyces spectabilis]|uniref:uncharacterized protein n=2 Tax=Radiomyces spectabilis TaxID=64574 RepID=UPI0022203DD8
LTSQVSTYEAKFAKLDSLLAEVDALRAENTNLRADNEALQARLAAALSPRPTSAAVTSTTSSPAKPSGTKTAKPSSSVPLGSDQSSWATVTKKYRPVQPVALARRQAAAARAFQPNDGPTGYKYLYVPRSRRLTRQEVRSRLRRLGIDPYRVLDIIFPARSVIGLLVHVQYYEFAMAQIVNSKIQPLTDFDPLAITIIGDPEIKQMPIPDQEAFVFDLHRSRCERAISHLPYHIASPVARSFLADGILDDADLPKLLYKCRGAPPQPIKDAESTDGSSNDPDQPMTDA